MAQQGSWNPSGVFHGSGNEPGCPRMGGNVLGTAGECSARADPAQPRSVFSTRSFLESYLWITTKLPPAFLGKS